ncbi:EAL domain-containing protein [Thalassobacillus hwangdonensis]|uniref:EAL domain-containing protein n=1 Tax=Thalassobacillus hwangdonensis TaxID=546108 RepID=A0ABW3KWB1_9BACI
MSIPEIEMDLPIHQWLMDHIQDAILFVNDRGEIIQGNAAAFRLIRYTKGSKVTMEDLFDFHRLKEKKETHLLMEIKNDTKQLFQLKCLEMGDFKEGLYCVLLHAVSLTEKTEEMKQHINQLINASYEGMVIHDEGKVIDCDQTFARMFGYEIEEMRHRSVYGLIDKKSQDDLDEVIHQYPDTPYMLKGLKKDGTSFYLEVLAHPYPYEGKILRVAIIRDVTDRVESERRIEFMAYYDELTDLPNRNYFNNKVNEAIRNVGADEKLAIHFLDLDYFKQINDTLGYAFGDKLLKACADRLKSVLDEDTFLARMGGDEFLILQKGVQAQSEVEAFAKRVITLFEKPVQLEGFELFTSVSIGISLFPDHGKNTNELIKQADSAMYVTKEDSRNDFKMFNASISENFRTMLTMETELRRALKENQFEIHYQPQKNIDSNEVIGMEALLRWNHPIKGYIPPGTFIPLAEKTGLIIDIGHWVLKHACVQNKKWQMEGHPPIVVGVNLSAKQFHQKNLVEQVHTILKETGLDAEYLELEITESMAMSNEEFILKTLQGLRELGVQVSIDDFGTGYSSMKYLSRFPVSKLKIDKVFITENKKQNQAIVKSIIHMSHSLNMKVIAEGVETEEQLAFLKKEKCDEMQGFFYSKPLPPKQIPGIFSDRMVN